LGLAKKNPRKHRRSLRGKLCLRRRLDRKKITGPPLNGAWKDWWRRLGRGTLLIGMAGEGGDNPGGEEKGDRKRVAAGADGRGESGFGPSDTPSSVRGREERQTGILRGGSVAREGRDGASVDQRPKGKLIRTKGQKMQRGKNGAGDMGEGGCFASGRCDGLLHRRIWEEKYRTNHYGFGGRRSGEASGHKHLSQQQT